MEDFFNTYLRTKEFHRVAGHPTGTEPKWPDEDSMELGKALIEEEWIELQEAINDKNIIAVADALGDLDVVINGMGLRMGLDMDVISKIVFESNMSKFCKTEQEALESKLVYISKEIPADYEQVSPGCWKVFNKETGKLLKSINFQEPDFSAIGTL